MQISFRLLHMERHFAITILICTLGTASAFGQWSKQDSLRLQQFLSGEEEIKLNENAVKSIRFGIPQEQIPSFQPIISTHKPALQFKEDLPDIFSDSLEKYKPRLVLRPYSIFTKYNEDPIHAPDNCFSRSWAKKIYPYNNTPFDPRMKRIMAGKGIGLPVGPGVSYSFSMEDVLQQIFSKKGRARLRNAKKANAWKTY